MISAVSSSLLSLCRFPQPSGPGRRPHRLAADAGWMPQELAIGLVLRCGRYPHLAGLLLRRHPSDYGRRPHGLRHAGRARQGWKGRPAVAGRTRPDACLGFRHHARLRPGQRRHPPRPERPDRPGVGTGTGSPGWPGLGQAHRHRPGRLAVDGLEKRRPCQKG